MPRIDDLKNKSKKKQTFRAYDPDILEKLKISKPSADTKIEERVEPLKKVKEKTSLETKKKKEVELKPIDDDKELKVPKKKEQDLNKKKYNLDFNVNNQSDISFKIRCISETEKKVMRNVYDICKKRNSDNTGDILSMQFDAQLEISRNSRETAIKRLSKKGLLQRNKGRAGKYGVLNLSISSEVLSEIEKIEGDFF